MSIIVVNFVLGICLFLILISFAFLSVLEKEKSAAQRLLAFSLLIPVPFIIPFIYDFFTWIWFSWILFGSSVIFFLVMIFPTPDSQSDETETPINRVDERNIMFSRRLLVPGNNDYDEYYRKNPLHKPGDDVFREHPGLLSPQAALYHPLSFAASNASFYTVEQLKNAVDGDINTIRTEIPADKLARFIKNWAKKLGALEVGITRLEDYHFYSFGGRKHNYGKKINPYHYFAIAFTVEMDKNMMASAPAGPTVMESAQQYLSSGAIAVQVAAFIRNLGYSARAHIDGNYHVVCPLVARDAGMGELGRMGLLMTPNLGPRVRISVVTTDVPLPIDKREKDLSVEDFCLFCKKCADVCPSNAISFEKKVEIDGVRRWQINQQACYIFWTKTGTDCGRCVAVCPYSHPDNLMHNLIRSGIRNSALFRRFALNMDNLIYGRKPVPGDMPDWMNL